MEGLADVVVGGGKAGKCDFADVIDIEWYIPVSTLKLSIELNLKVLKLKYNCCC